MRKKAFFVNRPRRLDDLKSLHLVNEEEPFEILKDIALRANDYKNFSEDLLADRAFLDDWNDKPTVGGTKLCIFVHRCNKPDGILVVPTEDSHVLCAAYWSGDAQKRK
ncbi:MAG: hypothetical protein ACI3V2_04420 [Faecousia sp.]